MPTPASQMALEGLRDLTTLKWYVIPLLAIVFYFYVAALIVIGMKSDKNKIMTIAAIYAIAVLMNVFGLGAIRWVY